MPSERIQRQIDRLLDEAEAALDRGDWALVLDQAAKALALDPENPDARHYAASVERARAGISTPPQFTPDRVPVPAPEQLSTAVTEPPSDPASPPDPDALYQRAFVGREAELRQLHAAFDAQRGLEGAAPAPGPVAIPPLHSDRGDPQQAVRRGNRQGARMLHAFL